MTPHIHSMNYSNNLSLPNTFSVLAFGTIVPVFVDLK